MKTDREIFEEKMEFVKEKTGTHPKIRLMMNGGPDFAESHYEIFFAIFLSGMEYQRQKFGLSK